MRASSRRSLPSDSDKRTPWRARCSRSERLVLLEDAVFISGFNGAHQTIAYRVGPRCAPELVSGGTEIRRRIWRRTPATVVRCHVAPTRGASSTTGLIGLSLAESRAGQEGVRRDTRRSERRRRGMATRGGHPAARARSARRRGGDTRRVRSSLRCTTSWAAFLRFVGRGCLTRRFGPRMKTRHAALAHLISKRQRWILASMALTISCSKEESSLAPDDGGACLLCSTDASTAPAWTNTSSPLGKRMANMLHDCRGAEPCHAQGSGGLTIIFGNEFADLIKVPSTERPDLDRVLPGDPAQSYLYLKLAGDGGIDGAQMPGGAVDSRRPALAWAWIEAGAPQEGSRAPGSDQSVCRYAMRADRSASRSPRPQRWPKTAPEAARQRRGRGEQARSARHDRLRPHSRDPRPLADRRRALPLRPKDGGRVDRSHPQTPSDASSARRRRDHPSDGDQPEAHDRRPRGARRRARVTCARTRPESTTHASTPRDCRSPRASSRAPAGT